MRLHGVIVVYCATMLIFGILKTKEILRTDNDTGVRETGRVGLLCSYWYEDYSIRDVVQWPRKNKVKVVPYIVDKAALAVYSAAYHANWSDNGEYVLTAYPEVVRNMGYTLTPVAGKGFMRIWRVSK